MSGPNVMMTLGSFSFELNAAVYQELQRVTEYRWAKQERFGQAPVRQYVGIGDDTITLPGVIFPAWRGGRAQVDMMRELADEGMPLFMMAGDGTIMGRWVIEKIEEKQSVFAIAGAPLKQEFTLNLAKFDDLEPPVAEPSDGDIIGAAMQEAEALNPEAIAAVSAADSAASLAGSVTASLSEAAAKIQSVASEVMTTVQPAIDAVRQGMTVAANLKNAALEAKSLVKRVKNISSLSDAQGALGGLMRISSSASAVSASAGKLLGTNLSILQSAGEVPAAIKAVQGAMVTMNKLTNGVTAVRKQTDSILNKFK